MLARVFVILEEQPALSDGYSKLVIQARKRELALVVLRAGMSKPI